MKRVRLGIIGAGRFTRLWHLPRLAEIDSAVVVALADPDAAQLAETIGGARLAGVRTFASAEELLAVSDMDAVIVASPHALHAAHVRAALASGRHVLVDKPVAGSSVEIRELEQAAAQAGLLLEVGYQRRFDPRYVGMREAVATGELGDLVLGVATLVHGWVERYRGHWRQGREAGGGVLVDSGRHLVDSLLWIVGDGPVTVSAVVGDDGQPFEVTAVLSVAFQGGAQAQLVVDGRVPAAHWHEEFAIWGRHAGVGIRDGTLVQFGAAWRRWPDRRLPAASPEQHFCLAVAGRQPPAGGARNDLRVAQLLEAAFAAARAGATLPCALDPPVP